MYAIRSYYEVSNQEMSFKDYGITPTVLDSEAEVGKAMLNELYHTAASKEGDINIACGKKIIAIAIAPAPV